ncbi:hypothetical protein ACE6H2_017262 [Prunus campanulata]
MSHMGGTKTFVRYHAEYEQEHGRAPDPIEFFDLVHKRHDENNSWIDDASEQIANKISQELTQLVTTHGEETSELRLQAYVAARGVESRGRVRGYGNIVTPDMVPWVVQTQPTSSSRRSRRGRDYACLESQFLELQENYERQQKEMEELRHMILSSHQQPLQPPTHQQSSSQERSPSQQQRSSSQQHSSSQQRSPSQHRSSQHQSPPQQTPSSHQYPTYQHHPYLYQPPSHLYYPQPYHPQPYKPMPYPLGEFSGMLREEFLQDLMSSDQRAHRPESS